MTPTESGGTCANCGAPLAPGDPACATCGRLAPAALPAHASYPTAPVAATKMTRSAEVIFGILAGCTGGIALTSAFVFASFAVGTAARKLHWPALFYVGIGVELALLVAMIPVGIRFAARGRVLLGTSLMVAGIVAVLPTAACDIALQGLGFK